MGMRCRSALLLITLGVAWTSSGVASDLNRASDVIAHEVMQSEHSPALALCIIQHGRVLVDRAYGTADLENDVPASNETEFSIASITKLMTAMVVLDSKLPLTDQIEVTDEDRDYEKNTGSRLSVGSVLSREDMLHIALMASENRAAAALSRYFPGGRPAPRPGSTAGRPAPARSRKGRDPARSLCRKADSQPNYGRFVARSVSLF